MAASTSATMSAWLLAIFSRAAGCDLVFREDFARHGDYSEGEGDAALPRWNQGMIIDVLAMTLAKWGFFSSWRFSIMGTLMKKNITVMQAVPMMVQDQSAGEAAKPKRKRPHQKVSSPK